MMPNQIPERGGWGYSEPGDQESLQILIIDLQILEKITNIRKLSNIYT